MSGTTMPEAAIQKDGDPGAREDDVGPCQGDAGDPPIDEVAESESMKPASDGELKGSVSALGVSHTPGGGLGAGLWCVRGHRAQSVSLRMGEIDSPGARPPRALIARPSRQVALVPRRRATCRAGV